uniref:C2H2-type domain-containing protein n=1 Tax=Parascaris univalens TaxID=6257 RepID=A0A915A8F8_PARUN
PNRAERLRDEFAFPSRSSVPSRSFHAQSLQHNNEILDLWPNGDTFNVGINGYGIGSTMFPNMASPPQLSVVYLRCAECGIGKTSSEEMEVHIKMEHLQWLPFQCPICSAERASDLQMREHIHSAHRKNSNKFIYVDNPSAKRLLQILMDRSLSSARRPSVNGITPVTGVYGNNPVANGAALLRDRHFNAADETRIQEGVISGTSSPPMEPRGDSPLRNLAALTNGHDHHTPPLQAASATATVVSRKRPASQGIEAALTGNSSTDALLSAIRAATQETAEERSTDEGSPLEEAFDDDDEGIGADSMPQIFLGKKRSRTEFDGRDDSAVQPDATLLSAASGGGTGEAHDPADILGNVAAMFNAEDVDVNGARRRGANGVYSNPRSKANSSSLSKKRVLGECSKCKKPVTAGARQMHMFYHLGKDCSIYRFKCKYPNCDVEHYRKDQMENHHSKQHGKIDPTLMEDRTAELFNSCQELSMQLLGTTGNTPGPTAAKAQLAYNATIAAQAQNHTKKKKKPPASFENIEIPPPAPVVSSPPAEPKIPTPVFDAAAKFVGEHPEEQTLECRLCHKLMYNRIRGFHILWHMAKDLGINRICV